MYNEGISKVGDIIDLATQLEIITKRGAFFSYGDIRLGQGRENAKEFLRQNLGSRQRDRAGCAPARHGRRNPPGLHRRARRRRRIRGMRRVLISLILLLGLAGCGLRPQLVDPASTDEAPFRPVTQAPPTTPTAAPVPTSPTPRLSCLHR